jgi:hypothetical protein
MAMRRQADYQLPDELVQFAYMESVKNAGMVLIRHFEQAENLPGIDHLDGLQESCMEAATPGVIRRLHNRLQRIEHERNEEARRNIKRVPHPMLSAHNLDN